MNVGFGLPLDWTNGTGVFPSGGSITISPDQYRQAVLIQNQDVATVAIQIAAVQGSGYSRTVPAGTACTATIELAAAAGASGQGGMISLDITGVNATGQIIVVGTATKKVCVLTN